MIKTKNTFNSGTKQVPEIFVENSSELFTVVAPYLKNGVEISHTSLGRVQGESIPLYTASAVYDECKNSSCESGYIYHNDMYIVSFSRDDI